VLQSKAIIPSYVAGHSLGEYSAHVAAGTLSFADAVRTVRNRGKYMQEAVPVGVGAMAAILALSCEEVQQVCEEAAQAEICQAANLNSPDQTVISGNKAAVGRATELAKHRGAKRAILLPVSAPFHCALMKPAQDRLAEDLRALTFHTPAIPLMCNVDASLITTGEQARDALIRQVTGTVQWHKSMRELAALGAHTFVEVGPGKVLCGLLRQIDRSRTCMNVEDEASLQKTVNHLSAASPKPD
jgi:[acyl-carrier-protein] S-malonyltransferase